MINLIYGVDVVPVMVRGTILALVVRHNIFVRSNMRILLDICYLRGISELLLSEVTR